MLPLARFISLLLTAGLFRDKIKPIKSKAATG